MKAEEFINKVHAYTESIPFEPFIIDVNEELTAYFQFHEDQTTLEVGSDNPWNEDTDWYNTDYGDRMTLSYVAVRNDLVCYTEQYVEEHPNVFE